LGIYFGVHGTEGATVEGEEVVEQSLVGILDELDEDSLEWVFEHALLHEVARKMALQYASVSGEDISEVLAR